MDVPGDPSDEGRVPNIGNKVERKESRGSPSDFICDIEAFMGIKEKNRSTSRTSDASHTRPSYSDRA